jgi:hypothetical protein
MEYTEHKSFKARWNQFFSLAKNPRKLLRYYLIDFHLDYNPEPVKYKKDVRRGLLIALLFASLFGIYENIWAFSIFDGFFLDHVYVHWILWWITTVTIAYFATNRRWDQILLSLLLVVNFEDVIFWMTSWIRTGNYPYPAGNWWDPIFASFRVLGNWGTATSFWPYFPRYYYVVGGMLIPYYIIVLLGGSKYGQIFAWLYLPAVIPVLVGLVSSELVFMIILIISMSGCYIWGFYLIYLYQKRKSIKSDEAN